jgi:hypothetical protein
MEEFIRLSESVRSALKLQYDADSVKYLEQFIEEQKVNFEGDELQGLITSCGAFLGQCIIENYGGVWSRQANGDVVVAFDERNMVYPFVKVSKQFANGLEDSVSSMFISIPLVFTLRLKTK